MKKKVWEHSKNMDASAAGQGCTAIGYNRAPMFLRNLKSLQKLPFKAIDKRLHKESKVFRVKGKNDRPVIEMSMLLSDLLETGEQRRVCARSMN
jgi:hypothetical protein